MYDSRMADSVSIFSVRIFSVSTKALSRDGIFCGSGLDPELTSVCRHLFLET